MQDKTARDAQFARASFKKTRYGDDGTVDLQYSSRLTRKKKEGGSPGGPSDWLRIPFNGSCRVRKERKGWEPT